MSDEPAAGAADSAAQGPSCGRHRRIFRRRRRTPVPTDPGRPLGGDAPRRFRARGRSRPVVPGRRVARLPVPAIASAVAVLAVAAAVAAVVVASPSRPRRGTAVPAGCAGGLPVGRSVAHIHGMNLPWIDGQYGHDLGPDPRHPAWGTAYRPERTAAVLSDIGRMGGNVARIWLFEDLEGLTLDVDGRITGIAPTFLANLDDLLRSAEKDNLFLYLTLLNAPPSLRPDPIGDPVVREDYLRKVVGPVAGRLKGNPAVFALEVGNELEEAVGRNGTTWATLRGFIAETTAMIHQVDPDRLVSSSVSESSLRAGHARGLGLDFYDYHHYADGWDLPACERLGVDRPVVIGEFGQRRPVADDHLQSFVVRSYQAEAKSLGYAGVVYWSYGGKDDRTYYGITRADGSWRPAAYDFARFGR